MHLNRGVFPPICAREFKAMGRRESRNLVGNDAIAVASSRQAPARNRLPRQSPAVADHASFDEAAEAIVESFGCHSELFHRIGRAVMTCQNRDPDRLPPPIQVIPSGNMQPANGCPDFRDRSIQICEPGYSLTDGQTERAA